MSGWCKSQWRVALEERDVARHPGADRCIVAEAEQAVVDIAAHRDCQALGARDGEVSFPPPAHGVPEASRSALPVVSSACRARP
jgi:hypothetical protein